MKLIIMLFELLILVLTQDHRDTEAAPWMRFQTGTADPAVLGADSSRRTKRPMCRMCVSTCRLPCSKGASLDTVLEQRDVCGVKL